MTYTIAVVVGVVGALLLDLVLLGTRLVLSKVFWLAYLIVLAAQLIANGVLTGRGIVRYDPHAIIGLRIAYAPVEDLGFGFALVLTVLALWVRLGRSGGSTPPR